MHHKKWTLFFHVVALLFLCQITVEGTHLRFVRDVNFKSDKQIVMESLEKHDIDLKLARTLVEYCSAVKMCATPFLKKFECVLGEKNSACIYSGDAYEFTPINVVYEETKDMVVLIGANHKYRVIFLAFKGTSSFQNLLEDFNLLKVNYPSSTDIILRRASNNKLKQEKFIKSVKEKNNSSKDMKPNIDHHDLNIKNSKLDVTIIDDEFVRISLRESTIHYGFYSIWNSIASDVFNSIKEAKEKYPDYKIVFTGHSLGGAIASLGAIVINLNETYTVDSIYTFGEPKLGNDVFAEFSTFVSPPKFRFVNRRDIVPQLPPWGLDYRHSGVEVSTDRFGEVYKICDLDCDDVTSKEGLELLKYNLHDHHYYLNFHLGSVCGSI
jgi:hypothetical protein